MNGSGGFIDISQTVKTIIFSGTMVVGSDSHCENNQMVIDKEGHSKKFVETVQSMDFNANYSWELGQDVYYVTERAVFQLTEEGMELIEIAPGLNLQKDVLSQMNFKPLVSNNLKEISSELFQDTWGKLAQAIKNNH